MLTGTPAMGTDTATYRARIGLFSAALRQRCHCKTKLEARPDGVCKLQVKSCIALYCAIFLLYGTVCTEINASALRVCRARLSRASAKASVLGLALYVSLLSACVTQPKQTPTINCDFSQRILLSGDISENPGPDTCQGTQTEENANIGTPAPEIASALETLRAQMHESSDRQTNILSDKINSIQNDILNTKSFLQGLCEQQEYLRQSVQEAERRSQAQYQHLIDWNKMFQTEQYEIKERLAKVTSEHSERLNKAERERENLELQTVRNNVRLFGVKEERKETYWDCLNTVMYLLREAVPDVDWQRRDIVRVQRLGTRSSQHGRPRPVLVAFATWSDKLALLQGGREGLRSKGVQVSSELTTRQAAVLRDLRSQGRIGYFRNNRLFYRDTEAPNFSSQAPRRTATNHVSTASDQRAAVAVNTVQSGHPGRPISDEKGTRPSVHTGPLDLRPPRFPRESKKKRNKANANNLITLSSAGIEHQPAQPDLPPNDTGIHSAEIHDPVVGGSRDVMDEDEEYHPPSLHRTEIQSAICNTHSSISSQGTADQHVQVINNATRDKSQSASVTPDQTVVVPATNEKRANDNVTAMTSSTDSSSQSARSERASCTQRTLLDWVVTNCTQTSATQIEEAEANDTEGDQDQDDQDEELIFVDARMDADRPLSSSNCEDAVPESPDSYRSVWRGRLRHSETVRPQASASAPSSQA